MVASPIALADLQLVVSPEADGTLLTSCGPLCSLWSSRWSLRVRARCTWCTSRGHLPPCPGADRPFWWLRGQPAGRLRAIVTTSQLPQNFKSKSLLLNRDHSFLVQKSFERVSERLINTTSLLPRPVFRSTELALEVLLGKTCQTRWFSLPPRTQQGPSLYEPSPL